MSNSTPSSDTDNHHPDTAPFYPDSSIPAVSDASNNHKRKRDHELLTTASTDDLPPLPVDPALLTILPRHEWKTDNNYRLICKISGCATRGRSEKDDMCKKHYSMFVKAGIGTGGREKKIVRRKKT
ncbi:hypothetical protein ACHAXN_009520 [Cyclotella atomus]